MEIKKAGVYGAGTMGKGIAQVALTGGLEVVLYNHREETLDKARGAIDKNFAKMIARGRITEADAEGFRAKLVTSTDINSLNDCDIVFECAPEEPEIKKAAFKELGQTVKADAVFASNTSSLSIADLAPSSERPDKFVGMHFFSPVPAMKLVEIVYTDDTSEETLKAAKAAANILKKEFVTVKDAPMFIANRIMCPMMNEAARLAGENICSYEDIDKACCLGYNQPMGPLALSDAIGIDVMYHVMVSLYEATGNETYAPAPMYKELYEKGDLGRKTGRGFYDYTGTK